MNDLLFYVFLAAVGGLVYLRFAHRGETRGRSNRSSGLHYVQIIEVALLLCAGAMGAFFAYQLFSSISTVLAVIAAVLVVFFNLAESILITTAVNSFRHRNVLIGGLSAIGILGVMTYSLTAGSSVIETIINKGDDIQKAYQYDVLASQQRIEGAKAEIFAAQTKARESDQYGFLNNSEVAKAQVNASTVSAQEYQRMAQLTRDKAPEIKIAFGFDRDAIAFVMAFTLELSILLVGIYKNLYVTTTPLLAAVRFSNKELNWNVNPNHLGNLGLEKSPAPEIVALPYALNSLAFAGAIPSAQPRVNTVSIHPAQAAPQPRAQGTQGLPSTQGTQGLTALNDANLATFDRQDELFDLWVMKLKSGELKPSTESTRLFIGEHKLATGIKLISALADSWLERASNIGVLKPTNAGIGKPKYIVASDNKVDLTKREEA